MDVESFQIAARVEALEISNVELKILVQQTAESCKQTSDSCQRNSDLLGRVLDALEGTLKRDGIVDDIRHNKDRLDDHDDQIAALGSVLERYRNWTLGAVAACVLFSSAIEYGVKYLIK